MGTLLTLIPACNRVKATSYRAEVDRYDADLEAKSRDQWAIRSTATNDGKPPD